MAAIDEEICTLCGEPPKKELFTREGKLIEHLSKEESENFVAALEELARAASTESKVEN